MKFSDYLKAINALPPWVDDFDWTRIYIEETPHSLLWHFRMDSTYKWDSEKEMWEEITEEENENVD
jgi:hypothetical protein